MQAGQRLHRQVRVHGFSAVARQHREVMHLARRTRLHHQAGRGAQALTHQVMVDGRQRQQRGDRHLGAAHVPVGDDQDVVAALDGVHRLCAQRGELGLHALVAPGSGVGDVEFVRAEFRPRVLLDGAQPGHVLEVENRLGHLQAHGRVHRVDVQQIGLWPDEAVERHDDGLADRVDRRVRHLGEQLLEVVVQRLVLVRQHRQRRVVAHGADAFFAVGGHRAHQELQVFLGVAEGLLAVEQRFHKVGGAGMGADRHLDGVELDAHVLDPLAVGPGAGELVLQFLVVHDAALLEVDQEHLAGLQAPLPHDAVLRDGQHAGLGGHHHQVVIGHAVARGAQAVAVQRRADLLAVGEDHGRRAIPGFDHRGVVLVERAAALVHALVLLPGLGDHHHGGVGQRVARHRQQFQRVVKSRGVALVFETDGVELLQVVAQHGRLHHAFAGAHPVEVALDGVDLAVVRHHAVRVRERPLRKGVGGKALVHQRQGGDRALVLQVQVVGAHLVGQQQALVDDGAAAHAGHVVLAAVRQLQRLDGGRGGLADHIQLALQRVGHDDIRAAPDEHLADHRLLGAHRGRHGHVAVHRHVTPAEQHLAFGADGALHLLLAGQARGVLLGQEDHAHAVLAGGRQRDAHATIGSLTGRRHLGAVELVRDLDQDAGAVTHQGVRAHRAAMVQVLQDLQALLHDGVRLVALDVRHEAHAAGVMLLAGVVQAVFLRELPLQPCRCGRSHLQCRRVGREGGSGLVHVVLLGFLGGRGRILRRSIHLKFN